MRLKSLPNDAKVYELFARRPDTFQPFVKTCEQIMRGPSALSAAERELLGSFVSALNACPFCHDVHNEAVKAYGIGGELAKDCQRDLATAAIDDRLKPLFALARKTTEAAYKVTDADFDAAYEAGWDDDAIQDTILVTCLFNFMNRLVSTTGIEADEDYLLGAGPRIRDDGYASSLEASIASD
jgi:uncharacterized peroxidase-related enzyme